MHLPNTIPLQRNRLTTERLKKSQIPQESLETNLFLKVLSLESGSQRFRDQNLNCLWKIIIIILLLIYHGAIGFHGAENLWL